MKKTTKFISAALAAALCAGLLAGCNSASSSSGSTSASGSASASASASASSSTSASAESIDYSKGLAENGHIDGVTALDYVTLPADYAAIPLAAGTADVSDEDVQAQIDSIMAQYAKPEQITDRAIEDGDQVNIDYSGSIDGEKFDGGTASSQSVQAGSAQFIDDFLTQIIGHTPGETFDVVVTFPDDYNDSTDADGNTIVLAGKEAVFKTTINYIEGDPIYPEFNDAFVTENLQSQYGWTTADQANEEIKNTLTEYNKAQYLQNYLLENAQVKEVPEVITTTLLEHEEANLTNTAATNGLPVEYLLMMYGYESLDAFREDFKTQYTDQIKLQMIYEAIADAEGLQPTEDDLKDVFGDNYDLALETYGGTAYPMHQLRIDNGYNFVMENATVA